MAIQPISDDTETLFRVQVGVYFRVMQAAKCLQDLRSAEYDGVVIKGKDGLYGVLVGTFTDIIEAQDLEAKLKSLRFRSYITTQAGEQVSNEEVEAAMPPPRVNPEKLDKVRIEEGAPKYGTAEQFPDWAYKVNLYVRYTDGDCVTVSSVATGPILGNVHKKYLTKI